MLTGCIDRVTASLHARLPEYGRNIAIDGSDMRDYSNGQRFVSKGGRERAADEYADPDASWGHGSAVSTRKGGGFYGSSSTWLSALQPIFRSRGTSAPLAITSRSTRSRWSMQSAPVGLPLRRPRWTRAMTLARSTRAARIAASGRSSCSATRRASSAAITSRPAASTATGGSRGQDSKRGASKCRCPTGECKPASVWIKADRLHPLIPRETPRFTALYRRRAAVEREFGRLKHEWALAPLRVRGLDRVRLHADLTILAKLTCTLAQARAVPLA
jgi:hypothetical protein